IAGRSNDDLHRHVARDLVGERRARRAGRRREARESFETSGVRHARSLQSRLDFSNLTRGRRRARGGLAMTRLIAFLCLTAAGALLAGCDSGPSATAQTP